MPLYQPWEGHNGLATVIFLRGAARHARTDDRRRDRRDRRACHSPSPGHPIEGVEKGKKLQ